MRSHADMVGPPKTLRCLAKLEANLVVICRRCGNAREFARQQLINELVMRRKSIDWYLLPHHFRCAACGGKAVRLSVVAFAGRGERERQGRFDNALNVLRVAVDQGKTARVDTPDVHAALEFLMPYCPESWPIDAYRDSAASENFMGRTSGLTGALNAILRQIGLPQD